MQAKIGSKYKITPTTIDGRYSNTYTLVHVFPAGVKPDGTLMRVYAAGPAGEPPPANIYRANLKERWVFAKDNGRFMITAVPMYFHSIEEVKELEHGNT